MGEQDSSIFPTNLEITGSSLTLSPADNIKTTSAPSATAGEIYLKSKLQTDELCPPNISPWPADWKEGSWWKQKTETHRASSGLLSAMDPGAMIKSGEEFWLSYKCLNRTLIIKYVMYPIQPCRITSIGYSKILQKVINNMVMKRKTLCLCLCWCRCRGTVVLCRMQGVGTYYKGGGVLAAKGRRLGS